MRRASLPCEYACVSRVCKGVGIPSHRQCILNPLLVFPTVQVSEKHTERENTVSFVILDLGLYKRYIRMLTLSSNTSASNPILFLSPHTYTVIVQFFL